VASWLGRLRVSVLIEALYTDLADASALSLRDVAELYELSVALSTYLPEFCRPNTLYSVVLSHTLTAYGIILHHTHTIHRSVLNS